LRGRKLLATSTFDSLPANLLIFHPNFKTTADKCKVDQTMNFPQPMSIAIAKATPLKNLKSKPQSMVFSFPAGPVCCQKGTNLYRLKPFS